MTVFGQKRSWLLRLICQRREDDPSSDGEILSMPIWKNCAWSHRWRITEKYGGIPSSQLCNLWRCSNLLEVEDGVETTSEWVSDMLHCFIERYKQIFWYKRVLVFPVEFYLHNLWFYQLWHRFLCVWKQLIENIFVIWVICTSSYMKRWKSFIFMMKTNLVIWWQFYIIV